MKKLKITIGGKDFYADMLTEEMPELCKKIEEAVPFTTCGGYPKVSTNELMLPTKINYMDPETLSPYGKGDIIFYSAFQLFCVFYGDAESLSLAPKFATLSEEECERLAVEAKQTWYTPGKPVTIDVVEV